jgi:hypothetical protein
MDVNETNRAIEVGFQVANGVLAASLVTAGWLTILGMSIDRVRLFWRRYPMPIVVPSAVALALSLGILGYFVLMLFVIDTSKSPVNYIPGYDGSGLIFYGFVALFGLVVSLAVLFWVVGQRRSRPPRD